MVVIPKSSAVCVPVNICGQLQVSVVACCRNGDSQISCAVDSFRTQFGRLQMAIPRYTVLWTASGFSLGGYRWRYPDTLCCGQLQDSVWAATDGNTQIHCAMDSFRIQFRRAELIVIPRSTVLWTLYRRVHLVTPKSTALWTGLGTDVYRW